MKLKKQAFDRKGLGRIVALIGLGSALVIPTTIIKDRLNKNLDNPMVDYYRIVDHYTKPASAKYEREKLVLNPRTLEISNSDLLLMTTKDREEKEIKDAFEIAEYQDNYPVLGRFIDRFLDRKLDISQMKNEFGLTLLMVAAYNGKAGNVNTLVIKKGANVLPINQKGHDALSYAIMGGHVEILDMLVKNGALKNYFENKTKNPITVAIESEIEEKRKLEIIKYLSSKDVERTKEHSLVAKSLSN